ncbi:SEL1-like repeat protein [Hydrogenimonas urashimensis]|uniref:SEL1-like repeat protein n=1 Tax=Hydrogenimonas urashimensis TaxID=2740515 RepID=UPI0019155A29|nr:SEL1-like repeat protein [Hydrogenimonas urashimensis]
MQERRYTLEEAVRLYEEERFEEALTALKQHRKKADAQYFIGMIYYEGFGVVKDMQKAKHWFKKASRQGSLDAEYMLLCCEGNTSSCCKA